VVDEGLHLERIKELNLVALLHPRQIDTPRDIRRDPVLALSEREQGRERPDVVAQRLRAHRPAEPLITTDPRRRPLPLLHHRHQPDHVFLCGAAQVLLGEERLQPNPRHTLERDERRLLAALALEVRGVAPDQLLDRQHLPHDPRPHLGAQTTQLILRLRARQALTGAHRTLRTDSALDLDAIDPPAAVPRL
jgi:hypothetical protein